MNRVVKVNAERDGLTPREILDFAELAESVQKDVTEPTTVFKDWVIGEFRARAELCVKPRNIVDVVDVVFYE